MAEYINYTNNDLHRRKINFEEFCYKCKHRNSLEKMEYPCYVCKGGYPSYIKSGTPYKYKEDKNA